MAIKYLDIPEDPTRPSAVEKRLYSMGVKTISYDESNGDFVAHPNVGLGKQREGFPKALPTWLSHIDGIKLNALTIILAQSTQFKAPAGATPTQPSPVRAAVTPSRECPCGIFRGDCDYHKDGVQADWDRFRIGGTYKHVGLSGVVDCQNFIGGDHDD